MLSLALVYAAGLLSKKLVDKLAGKSLDAILNEASRRIEAGEFPPNHTIERTLDTAVMKAVVTLAHRLHNPKAGGLCDAFKRGQVRHTLDEFWEAINGGILSGFAGEGSWLQLLEAAGKDKDKRKSFRLDLILTAEDGHNIGRFLEGKATDRYREHLEQEVFRWVAADGDLKANGHRPKRFDAFVKEGNPGLNGELVLPAFGDLVLIFFREDIKHNEAQCRAVMFNLLTGQQRQLDEVGNQISDVKVTLEQMNKALADLAGQHRKVGLRADWDTLWSDFKAEMDRRFDEVMAGLGKLQQSVETGFAETPAAVADELERRRLVRHIFEFKADISRIIKYAPAELIGREAETQLLNDAWAKVQAHEPKRPHILTFVALGGEGKTSLVAEWAADLAAHHWPGCDAAFAWSFYSQGTREQLAASSDLFLKEALTFFGDDADKQFAASAAGAFEKGQRLARIVGQRRCLLILDGLEPLQYAPTSTAFPPGQLKDQGVAKLLKDLATNNQGLCVVTTRYSLPDLNAFAGKTVREEKLTRLSRKHGVDLLQKLGVYGSERPNVPLKDGDEKSEKVNEFEKLVEDVKGHALTLTLLGGFLKRAFHGDIRQRDRVKFEKADEKMDGGHAFRTMAAYEQWLLRDGGDEGRRAVAVLRLMGLFDRPADAGCLAALRSETIPGLTEPLAGLADDDWKYCLSALETAKLLTVNRDAAGALVSLDAHPHIREFFAKQVREGASWSCFLRKVLHSVFPRIAITTLAWRAAHRRLYEHLCNHKEGDKPTLEDLQPLYQAVANGCFADRTQEALDSVLMARIRRGDEAYSIRKLGASGQDLAAFAAFFDVPRWSPRSGLGVKGKARVFSEAGFQLAALGRLQEALEPLRKAVESYRAMLELGDAGRIAMYLCEVEMTLGQIEAAKETASLGATLSKDCDPSRRVHCLCRVADALHQKGGKKAAFSLFVEAEREQKRLCPDHPLLHAVSGYQYCDLLLSQGSKDEVSKRAQRTLESHYPLPRGPSKVSEGLDNVSLGRASGDVSRLEHGLKTLRESGQQQHLLRGLLARIDFCGANGELASVREDLDEAWEIAERGPMKLFLADIHLHRARLFFREKEYPKAWISPQADLAAAEKLINACGYHRRDQELADAKQAVLH